jgi:cobalt transporter subunit CbtA
MIARALLAAVLAGIVAGLVATALHLSLVSPLIVAAERYEAAAPDAAGDAGHDVDRGGDAHDHATWRPDGGIARMAYTATADIVIASGLSLILVALFALRDRPVGWRHGLAWGLAGFLATAAIPALSLPPELPGSEAGDRSLRQLAWLAIAACSALGLWLLVFVRHGWAKAGGLLLVALAAFAVPVPETIAQAPAPADLRSAFLWRALAAALAMWLAIGALAGALYDRAMRREPAAA